MVLANSIRQRRVCRILLWEPKTCGTAVVIHRNVLQNNFLEIWNWKLEPYVQSSSCNASFATLFLRRTWDRKVSTERTAWRDGTKRQDRSPSCPPGPCLLFSIYSASATGLRKYLNCRLDSDLDVDFDSDSNLQCKYFRCSAGQSRTLSALCNISSAMPE